MPGHVCMWALLMWLPSFSSWFLLSRFGQFRPVPSKLWWSLVFCGRRAYHVITCHTCALLYSPRLWWLTCISTSHVYSFLCVELYVFLYFGFCFSVFSWSLHPLQCSTFFQCSLHQQEVASALHHGYCSPALFCLRVRYCQESGSRIIRFCTEELEVLSCSFVLLVRSCVLWHRTAALSDESVVHHLCCNSDLCTCSVSLSQHCSHFVVLHEYLQATTNSELAVQRFQFPDGERPLALYACSPHLGADESPMLSYNGAIAASPSALSTTPSRVPGCIVVTTQGLYQCVQKWDSWEFWVWRLCVVVLVVQSLPIKSALWLWAIAASAWFRHFRVSCSFPFQLNVGLLALCIQLCLLHLNWLQACLLDAGQSECMLSGTTENKLLK